MKAKQSTLPTTDQEQELLQTLIKHLETERDVHDMTKGAASSDKYPHEDDLSLLTKMQSGKIQYDAALYNKAAAYCTHPNIEGRASGTTTTYSGSPSQEQQELFDSLPLPPTAMQGFLGHHASTAQPSLPLMGTGSLPSVPEEPDSE